MDLNVCLPSAGIADWILLVYVVVLYRPLYDRIVPPRGEAMAHNPGTFY